MYHRGSLEAAFAATVESLSGLLAAYPAHMAAIYRLGCPKLCFRVGALLYLYPQRAWKAGYTVKVRELGAFGICAGWPGGDARTPVQLR